MGTGLGAAYAYYALALLAGLPLHAALLATYALLARPWRREPCLSPGVRRGLAVLDVGYLLLNPIVYLFVVRPGFLPKAPWPWLDTLALLLLLLFWGLRLLGGAREGAAQRRFVGWLLLVGSGVVVSLCVRDLTCDRALGTQGGDGLSPWVLPLATPLYAMAILAAASLLRFTANDERWQSPDSPFFLGGAMLRRVGLATLGVALLTAAAARLPATRGSGERLVTAHRERIWAASARHGLDPRILASVLVVTYERASNPFRRAAENAVAGAWLCDDRSHEGLARALDPSLGIAQITPVTAQTAIQLRAGRREVASTKETRDVPLLGPEWSLGTSGLGMPEPKVSAGKREVVEALRDPERSIELAALIVALYAAQWRGANPAWAIDDKPEILATLYQIGFKRSAPKPNPRANDFGREVREVFDSAWMSALFPAR